MCGRETGSWVLVCAHGVYVVIYSLGIYRCADIERQMHAIQKKRKELSDAATQQEKVLNIQVLSNQVYTSRMVAGLASVITFFCDVVCFRLRLDQWVTMTT